MCQVSDAAAQDSYKAIKTTDEVKEAADETKGQGRGSIDLL